MATDTRTFLDDPASLRALVDLMPADEKERYLDFKCLSLEAAFPGRKMVVYTLKSGRPAGTEIISFGDLRVDWETGPSATVEDPRGKTELTTVPRRITPWDLYLHIPQTFTLHYKGRRAPDKGVQFVAHYAVLVKTRSKEIHQVEGHQYCVTLNSFRERFPDLRIRY